MDQPTNLEITITGEKEDVKRAALVAQRRIHFGTRGFKESAYVFGDGSDFKEKMDKIVYSIFGSYDYCEQEDGTAEFSAEQQSYGCVEDDDIKEIANEIIKVAPKVQVHISAAITITYSEGYDLCVDIDYVDGKMDMYTDEYYYFADEEDDEEYE